MDGISHTITKMIGEKSFIRKRKRQCNSHILSLVKDKIIVTKLDGGGHLREGVKKIHQCKNCGAVLFTTRFDSWTASSPKSPTELWKELGIDYNPVLNK